MVLLHTTHTTLHLLLVLSSAIYCCLPPTPVFILPRRRRRLRCRSVSQKRSLERERDGLYKEEEEENRPRSRALHSVQAHAAPPPPTALYTVLHVAMGTKSESAWVACFRVCVWSSSSCQRPSSSSSFPHLPRLKERGPPSPLNHFARKRQRSIHTHTTRAPFCYLTVCVVERGESSPLLVMSAKAIFQLALFLRLLLGNGEREDAHGKIPVFSTQRL